MKTRVPGFKNYWSKDYENKDNEEKNSWPHTIWRCFYLLVPIFGQDNGFLLVIDGVRKEKERLTAAKLLHGPSFLLFIGSSSFDFLSFLIQSLSYMFLKERRDERWVQRCDPINSHSLSSLLLFPFLLLSYISNLTFLYLFYFIFFVFLITLPIHYLSFLTVNNSYLHQC